MRDRKNEGIALVASLFLIAILFILGGTSYLRVFSENRSSIDGRDHLQALLIAEGGLERALFDLRQDFESGGAANSWADGEINGIACGPDTASYYLVPYNPNTLGTGDYQVELRNVVGRDPAGRPVVKPDAVCVRSTGVVGSLRVGVETYASVEDYSPWKHAMFVGDGEEGNAIQGDAEICGPVHVLGDSLTSSDDALDLGDGSRIRNNYETMPAALRAVVPPCPKRLYNGELVDSLGAFLRVKHGQVNLSGSSTVGEADVAGDGEKETIDAVFTNDGYADAQAETSVRSDNPLGIRYDLGDRVRFPRLSDPHAGYATYLDYLRDNALVITDADQLDELADLRPTSSFEFVDPMGNGSIRIDGSGHLEVDGIVYVEGDVEMRGDEEAQTITYTGRGSLVVTGDAKVKVNLLTAGCNSFPANALTVMATNDVIIDHENALVAGLFYAERKIEIKHECDIAGSLVARRIKTTDIPCIYFVPSVRNDLPPGTIGAAPNWFVHTAGWRRLETLPLDVVGVCGN